MKRLGILVGVLVLLAVTVPVFAQGMFADVPTDHWAYQAVNDLQQKGFIIGYPDGTFGGKRAMTRYEFAMAISRLWQEVSKPGTGERGEKGEQGDVGPAGPQGSPGVTPEELSEIKRLAQEFKDELSRLGVDVDQLKKDVASLKDRVSAVEEEQKRVKITLRGDMIAQGTAIKREDRKGASGNFPGSVDIDGRPLGAAKDSPNQLLNNIPVLWDYDLTLKGRVDDRTTATVVINASTYLPAAGDIGAGGVSGSGYNYYPYETRLIGQFGGLGGVTTVTPWYFYVQHEGNLSFIGDTSLTIGKFPLQLTPYTLKLVDLDYYTNLPKTDSGDYPVTGIKAEKAWGSVDVMAFAVSHKRTPFVSAPGTAVNLVSTSLNPVGSRPFSQSAGARLVWNLQSAGKLGLTYLQAGLTGINSTMVPGLAAGATLSKAEIYGVDYNAKYMNDHLGVYAEWAKSDYKDGGHSVSITGVDGKTDSSTSKNNAMDAMLSYNTGGLTIGGGYRQIEKNFYAPGDWERIAFIRNPTNVKGGRGMIGYKLSDALDLNATYEQLDEAQKTSSDTQLQRITAGAKYKIYGNDYVSLGYENVQPKAILSGNSRQKIADISYIDVGYGHTFSDNLSLRFYYQYIDWSDKTNSNQSYKGNVAGTQLTVKF